VERLDASFRSQYAYPTSKKPHKKKSGKLIAQPKELIRIGKSQSDKEKRTIKEPFESMVLEKFQSNIVKQS
jgi:hypothetical protein